MPKPTPAKTTAAKKPAKAPEPATTVIVKQSDFPAPIKAVDEAYRQARKHGSAIIRNAEGIVIKAYSRNEQGVVHADPTLLKASA
jgi:hypothetical protein